MPSLKDIRGRIGSVRNIAQITRAMEMVAASRMKRAQDAILAARPYAQELEAALRRVAGAASEEVDPLLARRPVHRAAIIFITTDRGLVGSLNANATRSVLRWVSQRARSAAVTGRSRSRPSPSGARAATPSGVPGSPSRPTSRSSVSGRASVT